MKTKYIKIAVSDRLPEKGGFYYTYTESGLKIADWFYEGKFNYVSPSYYPEYWLEEVPDHEDEMREMLEECKLQLEYLNKPERGTANNVLSRLNTLLTKLKQQ
ncbi:hypothetical protein MP478_04450 [Chryseobacterium sp. WG14]|uniref:hypothetical protein n=1 Tax=Chryseobacterium sp. WG14 TaxID=2926909 RepID=UPI00211E32F0|nr:hypothetical protein [Chryseobacterium sp. WG14]MCQ9638631.1 hypothetical protein [Chryseobacterium sp. WG14]